MSHTLDVNRLQEVFDGLEKYKTDLSYWEQHFLMSIEEQYERLGRLSERQIEILEKIHIQYVP